MTTKKKNLLAKEFALAAAKIARDRNCTDIVGLDLEGISPATDYFIIATGSSNRQMKTVADEIEEDGRARDFRVFRRSGYEQGHWIVLDFIDIVVHIFNEDYREYYDLEMLWGDAPHLELEGAESDEADK